MFLRLFRRLLRLSKRRFRKYNIVNSIQGIIEIREGTFRLWEVLFFIYAGSEPKSLHETLATARQVREGVLLRDIVTKRAL